MQNCNYENVSSGIIKYSFSILNHTASERGHREHKPAPPRVLSHDTFRDTYRISRYLWVSPWSLGYAGDAIGGATLRRTTSVVALWVLMTYSSKVYAYKCILPPSWRMAMYYYASKLSAVACGTRCRQGLTRRQRNRNASRNQQRAKKDDDEDSDDNNKDKKVILLWYVWIHNLSTLSHFVSTMVKPYHGAKPELLSRHNITTGRWCTYKSSAVSFTFHRNGKDQRRDASECKKLLIAESGLRFLSSGLTRKEGSEPLPHHVAMGG